MQPLGRELVTRRPDRMGTAIVGDTIGRRDLVRDRAELMASPKYIAGSAPRYLPGVSGVGDQQDRRWWNCNNLPNGTVTVGGVGDHWGGYLQFGTGENCGYRNAGLFYFDRDYPNRYYSNYPYYYSSLYYPYPYYWPWYGSSYTQVYYHDSDPYDYGGYVYQRPSTAYEPAYEATAPAAPSYTYEAQQQQVEPYAAVPGTDTTGLVREADAAFAQGRYAEAERLFVGAIMADERDGYSKFMYAVCRFAVGDYHVAAVALRRALLTAPTLIDDPPDLLAMYNDRLSFEVQLGGLLRYAEDHAGEYDVVLLLGYVQLAGRQPREAEAIFTELSGLRGDDEVVAALRESAERLKAYREIQR